MFGKKQSPIITPTTPSLTQQANEIKMNQRVKHIEAKSEILSEELKQGIIQAEITVGEYKILMKAIKNKLDIWFNKEINSRNIIDIIKEKSDDQS